MASPRCVSACAASGGSSSGTRRRRGGTSTEAVGAAGAPHPALLPHNTAPHLSAPHTAGRLGLASHPWPPLDPLLAPQLHSPHLVPGRPQTRRHSAHREVQVWPPESLLVRQKWGGGGRKKKNMVRKSKFQIVISPLWLHLAAPPFI